MLVFIAEYGSDLLEGHRVWIMVLYQLHILSCGEIPHLLYALTVDDHPLLIVEVLQPVFLSFLNTYACSTRVLRNGEVVLLNFQCLYLDFIGDVQSSVTIGDIKALINEILLEE